MILRKQNNASILLLFSQFALSLSPKQEEMTIKEFFSFKHNALLWGNLIAMVVVAVLLVLAVLKGLNLYTHHGEAVKVPDVKGLSVDDAVMLMRRIGLETEVSDSNYVKTMPAGCVLDMVPVAGQQVKLGRTVFLTINTFSIPLKEVPDVADNSSLRQAEASLRAEEFKLDSVELVSGELDWVYGVKYNGRLLRPGEKVPIGATLQLLVGCGGELPADSDSVAIRPHQTPIPTQQSEKEEEWF